MRKDRICLGSCSTIWLLKFGYYILFGPAMAELGFGYYRFLNGGHKSP